MATSTTTSTVRCPECDERVEFLVTARHLSKTKVAVSIDLAPVREHVASHQARIVTELPITAR